MGGLIIKEIKNKYYVFKINQNPIQTNPPKPDLPC